MVAEKEARRESLRTVREVVGPGSKLARRAGALMLDVAAFDDWVMEHGGASGFLRWFCAQIASGVAAKVLCEHYGMDDGLLGDFLTEVPERLERYRRAQIWLADGYVAEAVGIADEENPDVVRDKLRVDTRLRVAAKYDRARFGDEKMQVGMGAPTINFVMADGMSVTVSVPDAPRVIEMGAVNGDEEQREDAGGVTREIGTRDTDAADAGGKAERTRFI